MNLRLDNSWNYQGEDWWDWSAYLTGSDLPLVDYVEYVLHPTFKAPLRAIKDPENGFRLNTSGWGTFDLKAIVHLKNKKKQVLNHELILETDPPAGRTDE